MKVIICLLLVIAFVMGVAAEAVLQVHYHINTGIQVMTKLLSQSDLGTSQAVGSNVGIVNASEKLIYSMKAINNIERRCWPI